MVKCSKLGGEIGNGPTDLENPLNRLLNLLSKNLSTGFEIGFVGTSDTQFRVAGKHLKGDLLKTA